MTRTVDGNHPDVPPALRVPRPLPRRRGAPTISFIVAGDRGNLEITYPQYTDQDVLREYNIQGVPMIGHGAGSCTVALYVRLFGIQATLERHAAQISAGLTRTSRWTNVPATQHAAALLTNLLRDPTPLSGYTRLSDAKLRALPLTPQPITPGVDRALADMADINTTDETGIHASFARSLDALAVLAAAWVEQHYLGHAAADCADCAGMRLHFMRGLLGHLLDPHLNAFMHYLEDIRGHTGEHQQD